jgi:hypothetical protein
VMTIPRLMRGKRVGVALSAEGMVAAIANHSPGGERPRVWSRPINQSPVGFPDTADLAQGLRELRELVGPKQLLRVALLPPLVQLKRIELPRLREEEVARLVARDPARYFLGVAERQVVGAKVINTGRRAPVPYLVATADAQLIEAIYQAAAASDWVLDGVVPAQTAWAAWALRSGLAIGPSAWLMVSDGSGITALLLEAGRLQLQRRFRLADVAGAAKAVVEQGRMDGHDALAIVLAGPNLRAVLVEELGSQSVRVTPTSDEGSANAALIAAHGVWCGSEPELPPERVVKARQRRSVLVSARLLAGAAALLVIAGGAELWGAHRELDRLKSRRAALRTMVVDAMRAREELDGLSTRLATLRMADTARSHWAAVLVSIAEYLPADAHLVAMRGSSDTLVLEGVARHAEPVFDAIQRAPNVIAVRADAPIRQEAQDSTTVEQFTLAARMAVENPPSRRGGQ